MSSQNHHIVPLLRTAMLLLFASAFLSRCATMLTPTGGPRDSIPPVIVSMSPENFATKTPLIAHGSKIYIEFDEFVQLKDQQKEFFTSPQMKKKPQLLLRGRGLVIQIKDTLRPNTTYALNFGSAIRDNNEGNPLYSMRYVFSTGDRVDSIICSGYTADSYKADSVSKSFIWFFPADSVENHAEYDSTLFKYKPAVIARAENNGIFIAQNLKPIPYRVYAIQDKNDNQMYDPAVDQVGFRSQTYNPVELPDFAMWFDSIRQYVTAEPQLYFRMFTDVAFRRQLLSQSERPQQHKAMLYFSSAHPTISSLTFDSIPAERVIIEPLTRGRDTLALWFNVPSANLPDTIKGSITYLKHDTLNVLHAVTEPLKLAWRLIETKEQEREREKLDKERRKVEAAGETWTPPIKKSDFSCKLGLSGEINPEEHLTIDFDYPLSRLDSAAVLLTVSPLAPGAKPTKLTPNPAPQTTTKADAKGEKPTKESALAAALATAPPLEDVPVHFVRDTAQLRRWRIKAPWKTGGEYTLTIPKGAFMDAAQLTNDSIVGRYTVADPEKFAVVKIQVTDNGDSTTRYIIQLLDAAGTQKQERRNVRSGTYQFNYVAPGEVRFRVIEDRNGNGQWDAGNLVQRLEAERAESYTNEEGHDIFVTKANWEIEFAMDMKRIFAPTTMQSLTKLLEDREQQRLQREAEKRAKEGPKKTDRDRNDRNGNNMNGNNMNGNNMNGNNNRNMNTTGGMFNNQRR